MNDPLLLLLSATPPCPHLTTFCLPGCHQGRSGCCHRQVGCTRGTAGGGSAGVPQGCPWLRSRVPDHAAGPEEVGQPGRQGAQVRAERRAGAAAAPPRVRRGWSGAFCATIASVILCTHYCRCRFYCCWDDAKHPSGLSGKGQRLPFELHYYVVDDSIEIIEVRCRHSTGTHPPTPHTSQLIPHTTSAITLTSHTFALGRRCTATTLVVTPSRCCSAAASCPRSRASHPLVCWGILTGSPPLV